MVKLLCIDIVLVAFGVDFFQFTKAIGFALRNKLVEFVDAGRQ